MNYTKPKSEWLDEV